MYYPLLYQLITVDECLTLSLKINRGRLRLFSEVLRDKIFFGYIFRQHSTIVSWDNFFLGQI